MVEATIEEGVAQGVPAYGRMMGGGFGGMLSVQIKGGKPEAMAVAARMHLFIRATSLGGTHSQVEHRASVEGRNTNTPQNLLRVSVGLEHIDDLIADFDQALNRLHS